MKKITAINASPRKNHNTGTLVREAAKGAKSAGAEVTLFDIYDAEKFTGCISCFGCKLAPNEGRCICRDGLTPILDAIRDSDGLILGSPNYLGDISAGLRALYERLVFQSITYKTEKRSYNERLIPVLFIMTSNSDEAQYADFGYDRMLSEYKDTLGTFVGPVKTVISGDTLQVEDYGKYYWTRFDPDAKKARNRDIFPAEKQKAYELGREMAAAPWQHS